MNELPKNDNVDTTDPDMKVGSSVPDEMSNKQSDPEPVMATNSAPTNYLWATVGVIVVIIMLVAGYWWYTNQNSDQSAINGSLQNLIDGNGQTAVAIEDIPDVVAEVNGVAINKAALMIVMQQTEATLASQGANLNEAAVQVAVQQQALDRVINNELLLQAANESGVVVSAEAAAAELDQIRSQFPDQATYEAELEVAGLTEDELKLDIQEQLAIESYLATEPTLIDLPPVTEAEARELYDQVAAQGAENLPEFATVQAQIEAQIAQQNEQTAVLDLLANLRAAADVEVFF